jgi:hypothetical protein
MTPREALLHGIPYHVTLAATGGHRAQPFRLADGLSTASNDPLLASACARVFPGPFHRFRDAPCTISVNGRSPDGLPQEISQQWRAKDTCL